MLSPPIPTNFLCASYRTALELTVAVLCVVVHGCACEQEPHDAVFAHFDGSDCADETSSERLLWHLQTSPHKRYITSKRFWCVFDRLIVKVRLANTIQHSWIILLTLELIFDTQTNQLQRQALPSAVRFADLLFLPFCLLQSLPWQTFSTLFSAKVQELLQAVPANVAEIVDPVHLTGPFCKPSPSRLLTLQNRDKANTKHITKQTPHTDIYIFIFFYFHVYLCSLFLNDAILPFFSSSSNPVSYFGFFYFRQFSTIRPFAFLSHSIFRLLSP